MVISVEIDWGLHTLEWCVGCHAMDDPQPSSYGLMSMEQVQRLGGSGLVVQPA